MARSPSEAAVFPALASLMMSPSAAGAGQEGIVFHVKHPRRANRQGKRHERGHRQGRGLPLSPRRMLLRFLDWYHTRVSPLFPARCKYYPTCSQYAEIAVRRFGAFRGGLLAVLRLLRCQPWSRGGIDDVPHKFSLFYRFEWSSAHEPPTTEPIIARERQSEMR